MARTVVVGLDRLPRWLSGFAQRNGEPLTISVGPEVVTITSSRGGRAELALPGVPDDVGSLDALLVHLHRPRTFACLLLRRSGFAVAHGSTQGPGHRINASKTDSRYVQGRTAAGGWSQQRFARRRDNQTRQVVDAVQRHAVRVLEGAEPQWLVTGGDRALLTDLLARPPLSWLAELPRDHVEIDAVRRDAVDAAVVAARAVPITVTNADDLVA